ncbi:hypothetical protein LQZ21_04485 [Treponema sp. TIM-1]|uniref:hypothetical protein n=1 Tax=Treponema sp. TIM-1 TaxID=2898417 RepID=UPI00398049F7
MTFDTMLYSFQTSPSSLFFIFNAPLAISYPPQQQEPCQVGAKRAIFFKKNIFSLSFFRQGLFVPKPVVVSGVDRGLAALPVRGGMPGKPG